MNSTDPLMPPMHADLIRGCGVGFGAHHFLPQHMGARPVLVVETTEPGASCGCCGRELAEGERALRVSYCFDSVGHVETTHLHAHHCMRGEASVASVVSVGDVPAAPVAVAA